MGLALDLVAMTLLVGSHKVCTVIMVHKDEQFLQVGRLYRALILLGLALCLPSASVSSVLMVLYRY